MRGEEGREDEEAVEGAGKRRQRRECVSRRRALQMD
jgi:hypothetical protein